MTTRLEELTEPLAWFPASERLPGARLVRLDGSGELALAAAASTDVIAATLPSDALHGDGPTRVAMRSAAAVLVVEASGEVTLGAVYQAADGKVAASGTVRVGVAITAATDDVVRVVPD
ncbi:hypothetical protein Pla123a_28820 [Posidoniimonas polymericola]|uniref:Uncharacterized protein n=1 Tax=Posidoniimonas polymericola TaxID=2528002 RepID=A0A5C5YMA2_9BACT|nr:hypothetical protein [Posidoniimonas polymericola]TWT76093.1 hypothetical protein Pla123a_28820 [Posidoniimonas polymericola]